jgi:hypothetical protein
MAIDTDLNTVSRDIFDRCGFVRERDGYIRRNAQKPNMAPHLCVKVADDIGVARDIVRGFQRLLLRARRNSA